MIQYKRMIKELFTPTTPEQLAQRQLLKARLDLLEAHRMKEMWEAQVECHQKIIARLEGTASVTKLLTRLDTGGFK